mmetsp:Transcript_22715/g.52763  ORF Transcript_22715/g.52763 Transcript_22715/m.52763 type:complete len:245 (+) Transcript_22715:435-1169(+)
MILSQSFITALFSTDSLARLSFISARRLSSSSAEMHPAARAASAEMILVSRLTTLIGLRRSSSSTPRSSLTSLRTSSLTSCSRESAVNISFDLSSANVSAATALATSPSMSSLSNLGSSFTLLPSSATLSSLSTSSASAHPTLASASEASFPTPICQIPLPAILSTTDFSPPSFSCILSPHSARPPCQALPRTQAAVPPAFLMESEGATPDGQTNASAPTARHAARPPATRERWERCEAAMSSQ